MSLNRKLFSISASDAVCNSESLEPFGNEASFNKNVAVYQFEESSGTTLTDSSGNGNNATISGMTWSSDAAFGSYSGSFDGTNDYVELPSNILPENSTSSSTATCWFKTTYAGTEMGTILNSYNAYAGGTSSTPGWTIFTEGSANFLRLGSYYLDGSNVVGTDGTTNVSDGNWHFIAVVFDISANTLKCYLDGNSSPEISITGLTTSTVDIFTGNATIGYQKNPVGSNRYFNGQIDQVRIYSKALNTEEISTLYVDETDATASSTAIIPGTSCIAYYPLDYDGQDKSTNYDGTATAVDFVQNGKINYSARFDGVASASGSRITIPQAIFSDGALKTFTISLWFKTGNKSASQTLISTYPYSSGTGFSLFLTTSGHLVGQFSAASGSGAPKMQYQTDMCDNDWHHATLTYSSSGGTNDASTYLYVDGSDVTGSVVAANGWVQGSVPTWSSFTSNLVTIGMAHDSSTYSETMNGLIDEVRIFNTALSASNVTTLAGLRACTQTCTTDTADFIATNTAYYKLDNDATDYHGGTYDATATNITYASGRFGSSAEFNGSSSILDTTVSVPTNWTLSLWLKRDPSGYFGGTTNASIQSGVYFYSNPNGSIAVYNRDGSGGNIDTFYSSAGLVNQNQWHHIAMSFDSTSGTGLTTIYIDGSEIGSVDGTPSHSTAFKFGRSGDYASEYFDGYIDQIRIFSSALTDTNIQDLYDTEFQCYITKDASQPFGSGEVAFFKFQNNLTDSTGSYAASAENDAYTTTDPAFGTYSLSFNDTDNYIDFGTSGKIPVVGVSYWVKMNAAGSATRDAIIHSEETSSTYFGCVRWGTSDSATGFYAGGSYWNYSGSDWDLTGKWHHIYQDKDLNVYLNGVQINSGSVGATSQNIRYIGTYPTGNSDYYMNGYMAQLRVFSTALTGEQVWKLYAERNN